MPLVSEALFARLFVYSGFAGVLLVPLTLVIHVLMPRQILDRYWQPPHFLPGEIALLTRSFYAPLRTVMFTWVIAFPRFGRKRQLEDAHLLAPTWFRMACIAVCVGSVVVGASLGLHALGFFLYYRMIP